MHISIRWRDWWFLNGHLHKQGQAVATTGKAKWECWPCVFCGKEPHQIRQEKNS